MQESKVGPVFLEPTFCLQKVPSNKLPFFRDQTSEHVCHVHMCLFVHTGISEFMCTCVCSSPMYVRTCEVSSHEYVNIWYTYCTHYMMQLSLFSGRWYFGSQSSPLLSTTELSVH